jgi:FAD/FMN-containing dehydrogenase
VKAVLFQRKLHEDSPTRMTDVTFRPPRQPLVPPGGADLHARDMTATFSADMTLGEAQRRLAELDQWLPVDGDPDAALGSLVEGNSTGPLRLGYGAWRDLLLGVQFTNGRGDLITAGGRTVKNVAGYDLTKFMVGQHGAFGTVVTLTTRTYRRPAGAVLARHRPDPAILPRLLTTDLRPQWAVLTAEALLLGYLGDETTVDYYVRSLPATEPVETVRRSLDQDIEHRARLWAPQEATRDLVPFRASVPPARVLDFVASARPAQWSVDAAFGIVVGSVASGQPASALQDAATAVGGTITAVTSTTAVERQIIERLKAAFDPDGNLAPLPWQTR